MVYLEVSSRELWCASVDESLPLGRVMVVIIRGISGTQLGVLPHSCRRIVWATGDHRPSVQGTA